MKYILVQTGYNKNTEPLYEIFTRTSEGIYSKNKYHPINNTAEIYESAIVKLEKLNKKYNRRFKSENR